MSDDSVFMSREDLDVLELRLAEKMAAAIDSGEGPVKTIAAMQNLVMTARHALDVMEGWREIAKTATELAHRIMVSGGATHVMSEQLSVLEQLVAEGDDLDTRAFGD